MSVSKVTFSSISANAAKVTFETNRAACSAVQFRKYGEQTWQTVGTAANVANCTRATQHQFDLTSLAQSTRYQARAVATEKINPTTIKDFQSSAIGTFVTLFPLQQTVIGVIAVQIADIAVTPTSSKTAKVAFTLSRQGTAKVRYAPSATLASATTVDAANTSGNVLEATLTVDAGVTNYYQIEARTGDGAVATTQTQTFRLQRYINIEVVSITVLDSPRSSWLSNRHPVSVDGALRNGFRE